MALPLSLHRSFSAAALPPLPLGPSGKHGERCVISRKQRTGACGTEEMVTPASATSRCFVSWWGVRVSLNSPAHKQQTNKTEQNKQNPNNKNNKQLSTPRFQERRAGRVRLTTTPPRAPKDVGERRAVRVCGRGRNQENRGRRQGEEPEVPPAPPPSSSSLCPCWRSMLSALDRAARAHPPPRNPSPPLAPSP